jgi:DNA polymerase-1
MLFDTSAYVAEQASGMKQSLKTSKKVADQITEASRSLVWPSNYTIANTPDLLTALHTAIIEAGEFIFDVETLGLNAWADRILCISFWTTDHGWLVPFEHLLMQCVGRREFADQFRDCFDDPDILRSNHNIAFDAHFMEEQLGMHVAGFYCDTLVQSQVINPDTSVAHGLKELCAQYGLAGDTGGYTAQFGKTAWSHIEPKLAAYYAIKDCELVHLLMQRQNERLAEVPDLLNLFWGLEMPIRHITYQIERRGIRVDMKYVDEVMRPTVYTEWQKALDALAPLIEPYLEIVGAPTVQKALDSTPKAERIFFDYLDVPLIKHVTLRRGPPDGEFVKRSLDAEAIAGTKRDCVPMALLSEYRKWNTCKKMFVDPLAERVVNGRIHPSINGIVGTGRMSMSNPNFQQVPSRMGALVRNAFIPDDGNTLMSADFSSQEMRIMAHYTKDAGLIRFFTDPNALDPYSETALMACNDPAFEKELFRAAPKNVRKENPFYRNFKALVLGLGFGMAAPKYARQTGVPLKEAKANFDAYHTAFPGVETYQKEQMALARERGYTATLLGRRRPLPHIRDYEHRGLQAAAERASYNTPVQGSAGDMLKLAVRDCSRLIQKNNWPVQVWLLVHDEIIFEMPITWAKANPDAIREIITTMENALPLIVPNVSSATFEIRWGTAMEIDDIADDLLDAA